MNTFDNKPPAPKTGIERIWKAFFYSMEGLKHGVKNETAFRQEILLSCILIPFAILLPVSAVLKLILIICNIFVLITELLNSGIESVADKVCPEYDLLAKQAKDMGSAAVLLSIVCLIISWALALYQVFF